MTGPTFTGIIKAVDANSITFGGEGGEKVFKLTPGAKVTTGKDGGKLTDFQPGMKVTVTLTSDSSAALSVSGGPRGDKEGEKKPEKKPETKPEKKPEKKPDTDDE